MYQEGDRLNGSPPDANKEYIYTPTAIIHINQDQKYKMVIERAAVKGIDGFKVEANGDDTEQLKTDIGELYKNAHEQTTGIIETKCD